MIDFAITRHCASRRHCVACRSNAAWWQATAAAFNMPPQGVACPHGITADNLPVPSAAPAAAPRLPMPGDVLHEVIRQLGFEKSAGCGCASMQSRMNQWGWLGCWQRRDEIVAWLAHKARERGITVTSDTVAGLLAAAFRAKGQQI